MIIRCHFMKVTAEGEGEEWQKRKGEEISEYNNIF